MDKCFFISSLKDLALKIMLNNKLSQSLLVSVSLLILFSSSLQAQPITKDMLEEQHKRIQEASSVTPITSVLEILNQRLYKPSELKELLALIQSFPRPGIGQAQMAEQLNAYGINAFNQKDYSLAVKLFQRAAKANPAETSIWCNLAASGCKQSGNKGLCDSTVLSSSGSDIASVQKRHLEISSTSLRTKQ